MPDAFTCRAYDRTDISPGLSCTDYRSLKNTLKDALQTSIIVAWEYSQNTLAALNGRSRF